MNEGRFPSATEIPKLYEELKKAHKAHLKAAGVKFPRLKQGEQFTKNALTLILLYKNLEYPVTKKELTKFIRQFYPDVNDVQQGRHLGNRSGWCVLTETRGDHQNADWPKSSYGLMSITEPHPDFRPQSRTGDLDDDAWNTLKKHFDFRCATCGSKEGEPGLRQNSATTRLQKGHMDPNKELTPDNCIPQCEQCNRPARQWWIWDKKGRPHAINDPSLIDRSPENIQELVWERLNDKYGS
jgi:hypothetical protein